MPDNDNAQVKEPEMKDDKDTSVDNKVVDEKDDNIKDDENKVPTPKDTEDIDDNQSIRQLNQQQKDQQRIQELEKRLSAMEEEKRIDKAISDSRAILQENELYPNDTLIRTFVGKDEKETFANVGAFVEFCDTYKKSIEKTISTGVTPVTSGNTEPQSALQAMLEKYK